MTMDGLKVTRGQPDGSTKMAETDWDNKYSPISVRKFVRLDTPTKTGSGTVFPAARSGHRCVADNGSLYVYGGYNPDFEENNGTVNMYYPLFRELWRYSFSSNAWTKLSTGGNFPTELASMSVLLHGKNLVVFGGTGVPFGDTNSNRISVCNLERKEWCEVSTSGELPQAIYGQAMVTCNGFLYVFGGTTGFEYNSDLHRLHLKDCVWEKLEAHKPPSGRYRHEVAYDDSRLYVLGGGICWVCYSFDQIPAYNFSTRHWEEMSCRPSTRPRERLQDNAAGYPSARRCHSCVQYGNAVYICGGYNGWQIFDDIWKLALDTMQWTKLPSTMPEPAYFHAAAITPAGCMYVHGGVVSIEENRRTSSLYRIWLVLPSLLELTWQRVNDLIPNLHKMSQDSLHSIGLPPQLMDRLKQ
ncbi:kelch domain-containing protein 10-like [Branchiostoma lanceolatum]|uniref:kelch domain-containing protein 10-like n=1 Tax=Branchiostoma lanceolatum TaxID=7740 RepID=UPI003453632C